MDFHYLCDLSCDIGVFIIRKIHEHRCLIYTLIILNVLLMIISIIILIYVIYYLIYKMYNHQINSHSVQSDDLSQTTKNLLYKYGKYKINKIYYIKQPITNISNEFLELFSLCNYKEFIREINHTIVHSTIMIEIFKNGKNNKPKFIVIDKLPGDIRIRDKFTLQPNQNIKLLNLNPDNKISNLNQLFNKTIRRVGLKKALAWNLLDNTCETFTNEILKTLDIETVKTQQPIMSDYILDSKNSRLGYIKNFLYFFLTKILNVIIRIVDISHFN